MNLSWRQTIGLESTHCVELKTIENQSLLVNHYVSDDLENFWHAANAAKIQITILTSRISFAEQLEIWNDLWLGYQPVYSRHGRPLNIAAMSKIEKYKAICLTTALPGLSRYHWGTDFEIGIGSQANNSDTASLEHWLNKNLSSFGFYRPYVKYDGGVAEQPRQISHREQSTAISECFDFDAHREYLESSDISDRSFILEQLQHYREKYFILNTSSQQIPLKNCNEDSKGDFLC